MAYFESSMDPTVARKGVSSVCKRLSESPKLLFNSEGEFLFVCFLSGKGSRQDASNCVPLSRKHCRTGNL